jgi:hypothetical protein
MSETHRIESPSGMMEEVEVIARTADTITYRRIPMTDAEAAALLEAGIAEANAILDAEQVNAEGLSDGAAEQHPNAAG